jgi:predicted anti-sigma-YlaC factor YlaD
MTCTEISHQLPEYVLGRLSADRRALVDEHVARCRSCAEELADLQRLAQAIRRQGAVLLEDHLSAEVLVEYAWNLERIDAERRYFVLRHLALCETCRLEYKLLLRVNESLPIRETPAVPEALPVYRELPAVPRPRRVRPPAFSWVRRHAVAWAAIVVGVVSAALTLYFIQERPPVEIQRGSRESIEVEAQFPLGLVARPPRLFAWHSVPRAKAYRVSLYNSLMKRIWQSEQITTSSIRLPADVIDELSRGQRYFWKVEATLEQGRPIESRPFEFRLE